MRSIETNYIRKMLFDQQVILYKKYHYYVRNAFFEFRKQASDVPEMLLDEINAEIMAVRVNREKVIYGKMGFVYKVQRKDRERTYPWGSDSGRFLSFGSTCLDTQQQRRISYFSTFRQ